MHSKNRIKVWGKLGKNTNKGYNLRMFLQVLVDRSEWRKFQYKHKPLGFAYALRDEEFDI